MSKNIVPSKIPVVAEHILNQVEARLKEVGTKQLTDEELLTLHSVFGATLQRAFDILEKYSTLTAYTTSKRARILIEIKGDNDRCYRIFPRVNFCPCRAFKHQVIERKSQVCCKHVLAGRIAQILGKTVDHEVTKEQYLMLVTSMFDLDQKDG